jgi:hypothetical protein
MPLTRACRRRRGACTASKPPARYDSPVTARHLAYVEADFESIGRGGSTRTAVCLCGWKGPQRSTLELAADDALMHERTIPVDRHKLVERIASNKEWLSKNWHQGKDVRRGCQANLEADERALAKLDEAGE